MLFPLFFAIQTVLAPGPDAELYVGTYTSPEGSKGIYRVRLNTDSGELSGPVVAADCTNPSYLALNSTGKCLYAVDESGIGHVSAFAVAADHSLTLLNTQLTLGSAPCHVSVAPGDKDLLIANYSSGNVVSLPINPDGSLLVSDQNFQNTGAGPNRDRQEGPHMHSIQVDARKRFCFACDLGTDEVLVFPFDTTKAGPTLDSPTRVKSPAGSGPRHFDVSRNARVLYVANELKNTVSVFAIDAKSGSLSETQNISTLGDVIPSIQTTAAEIFCHPNGKWLYVSTRGYDSLACFSIERSGRLRLTEVKKLSVRFPRGFGIDPTGKWIVVGGQMSNDLEALKIDQKTGGILTEGQKVAVPSPVSVLFAKS